MNIRPTLLVLLVAMAAIVGGVSGGLVARGPETMTEGPLATASASAAPSATATPTTSATPRVAALPDIPTIISTVAPSVVTIDVVTLVRYGPRTVTEQGAGTGFVLTSDGAIGTVAHVVAGAQEITVTLSDGTTAAATIVGTDTNADLAVISIGRSGLVPISTGRSSGLRVGDLAIAVGNALALAGGPTASLGIVSALDRTITTTDGTTYTHLIQTDAAINAGDSGGPLVDSDGRMIGINTATATTAQNIGFAIAIDAALVILERLRAGGS